MKYPTAQVAQIFDVTPTIITQLKIRMNLHPEMVKAHGTRINMYSEEDLAVIEKYFRRKRLTRGIYADEIARQNEPPEDPHILVTDRRCLAIGYWPDTVPKCFEDLEVEE